MKRKAKAMAMSAGRNAPSPVHNQPQQGNDMAATMRWMEFPTNAKEILTKIG